MTPEWLREQAEKIQKLRLDEHLGIGQVQKIENEQLHFTAGRTYQRAPHHGDSTQMNKVTLFHTARTGGVKQWSIWIEADKKTVTVEWGIVGKKLQTSSDTAVSKGKEGTKAFKDVYQCAQENYERQLRKKREEGYAETLTTTDTSDWMDGLTKTFVPSKPLNSAKPGQLEKYEAAGTLIKQRKRDGRRILALKTRKGQWRVYTRRIEDVTANLAWLVEQLSEFSQIPNGTIIDGEVIVDVKGADDFRATGTFTNPAQDPTEANERAAVLPVRYMVFDILYFNEQPVWGEPYRARHNRITDLFGTSGIVHAVQNLNMTLARAQQNAQEQKWEGLVCWFANEGGFVRDGGKPKRCNAAKWKPFQEKDFIATGYYHGSGEMSDVAGGLNLREIDPITGKMRSAGNCGTGFDADTRIDIAGWDFPCVVKIKYEKQEADSGKLRFPVFLALHEDKSIDECVGIELSDEEDE